MTGVAKPSMSNRFSNNVTDFAGMRRGPKNHLHLLATAGVAPSMGNKIFAMEEDCTAVGIET